MGARGSIRGLFSPTSISAVGAWLRVAGATDTGTLSVPDVLGGSPAIQATAARKPTLESSGNGLPIMTFADDLLAWPLGAANNGTVRLGYAFWLKLANTTGSKSLITTINTAGGASTNKLNYFATGSAVRCDEGVVDRHAQSGTLDTGWHFITLEIDCSLASEALQVLETIDAVAQSVSFSSGTAWPASMANPTGNSLIGALTVGASTPLVGSLGPNIFALTRQLTALERSALMAFEAPT